MSDAHPGRPDTESGTAPATEIVLVAVIGADRVIGADGDQPFRIPADQRRFKAMTTGSAVVMGRRTFDAMGGALPRRRNIVVTRRTNWRPEGAETVPSLEEGLRLAGDGPVFVIGGGEIYVQALPVADRLELTEVDQSPGGDTFFPVLDRSEWVVSERDQRDGYAFVTYRRSAGAVAEVAGPAAGAAAGAEMGQPGAMSDDSIPAGPGTDDIPDAGQTVPPPGEIPNPDTGVGIGAGQPSTFEPEETEQEPGDPEVLPS